MLMPSAASPVHFSVRSVLVATDFWNHPGNLCATPLRLLDTLEPNFIWLMLSPVLAIP